VQKRTGKAKRQKGAFSLNLAPVLHFGGGAFRLHMRGLIRPSGQYCACSRPHICFCLFERFCPF